jgi:hypothetical protein
LPQELGNQIWHLELAGWVIARIQVDEYGFPLSRIARSEGREVGGASVRLNAFLSAPSAAGARRPKWS